jgi:hypothetical protein
MLADNSNAGFKLQDAEERFSLHFEFCILNYGDYPCPTATTAHIFV